MAAAQKHQGELLHYGFPKEMHRLFHMTTLSELHVRWIVHPITKDVREPEIVKPVDVPVTRDDNHLTRPEKAAFEDQPSRAHVRERTIRQCGRLLSTAKAFWL
jgi:hypothetical protein